MIPPQVASEWLNFLAAIVAVGSAVYALYRSIFRRAQTEARTEFLIKRYERLYAPMEALFLTRHVVITNATLAPYWQQRVRRARHILKQGIFIEGIRALFDKRETKPFAEFEFGNVFPIQEIQQILKGNEAYADEKLLRLIQYIDRERYIEEVDSDDAFTNNEYELFTHIIESNKFLKRKLAIK